MRTEALLIACLFIPSLAHAEPLAVDEPLNANARQNIRPVDELLVDRNYELFADPRVRVGYGVTVVPAVDEPTNAKVRAASRRPTTTGAATTRATGE